MREEIKGTPALTSLFTRVSRRLIRPFQETGRHEMKARIKSRETLRFARAHPPSHVREHSLLAYFTDIYWRHPALSATRPHKTTRLTCFALTCPK